MYVHTCIMYMTYIKMHASHVHLHCICDACIFVHIVYLSVYAYMYMYSNTWVILTLFHSVVHAIPPVGHGWGAVALSQRLGQPRSGQTPVLPSVNAFFILLLSFCLSSSVSPPLSPLLPSATPHSPPLPLSRSISSPPTTGSQQGPTETISLQTSTPLNTDSHSTAGAREVSARYLHKRFHGCTNLLLMVSALLLPYSICSNVYPLSLNRYSIVLSSLCTMPYTYICTCMKILWEREARYIHVHSVIQDKDYIIGCNIMSLASHSIPLTSGGYAECSNRERETRWVWHSRVAQADGARNVLNTLLRSQRDTL